MVGKIVGDRIIPPSPHVHVPIPRTSENARLHGRGVVTLEIALGLLASGPSKREYIIQVSAT